MTDTIHNIDQKLEARNRWARIAQGAGIAIVAWAIVTHVVARVPIPPVIVIGIVFGAFVPFLNGRRRKLGLIFGILGSPGTGRQLASGDARRACARPESAPAFILTLYTTIVVIGVHHRRRLGNLLRLSRRNRARALAGRRDRRSSSSGTVVASVVVALNTPSDTAAASGDIEVDDREGRVPPRRHLRLEAGTIGVWVDNRDGIHHTFTIEELDVDLEIPALKAKRVEFDAPAGTYEVICTVPGHESMTATLTRRAGEPDGDHRLPRRRQPPRPGGREDADRTRGPDLEVVGVAADYDELVSGAEQANPQVVVTDIRMPPTFRREGIEAAHLVRQPASQAPAS